MNHRAILTALVAAAALTAAPVSAQNISGTWQITSEGRRGPQTQTLTLLVEGSTLTGSMTFTGGGRRGGGGGGGGGQPQAIEISDGTVDGNSFSFSIVRTFEDNSFTQTYSGTFEGDTLEGAREGGGRGGRGGRGGGGGGTPRPFTGTRAG